VPHGHERFVPGIPAGLRSPDWTHVAFVNDGVLTVSRVDGSDAHALTRTYDAFTWSPDSERIAFVTDGGALVVANADGTGQREIARGAMPAWRPDGRFLAYVRGTDKPSVHVVASDGTADAAVESGRRADVSRLSGRPLPLLRSPRGPGIAGRFGSAAATAGVVFKMPAP
jgi:hypothetical protein